MNYAYRDVSLIINGEKSRFRTEAATVGEALAKEKIVLGEKDFINVKLDDRIYNDIKIEISRAIKVTAIVEGARAQIRQAEIESGSKVGNLITALKATDAQSGTAQKYTYVYDGLLTDPLENGSIVRLKLKTVDEERLTAPVEFTEIRQDDPELPTGIETVAQEGENGEKEFVYMVTKLDGVETERVLISEAVSKPPQPKIVRVGVKPPPALESPIAARATDSGPSNYSKVIRMEATAYTDIEGDIWYGKTATGIKPRVGIVAVDPRVIPLHTELYVEGYGYALAADTGGAIKGNKIDLFMNSVGECYQFGRRMVTVYVLE